MFNHQEADRVPIIDHPWAATIERWQKEGMQGDFVDYFGLDQVVGISGDTSPRYPVRIVEETEEYTISTTPWGATLKNWRHAASTPEFLDFTIKDPASWREAKQRMTLSSDRINWERLKKHYKTWREKGLWIQGGLWFGFDVTHSWTVGTERLLMAMVQEPEWCVDMFNHFLDMGIGLLQQVWDQGYTFDAVRWPDDMGYKYNQFFSLNMYRELLKPVQKRACDWAHSLGIKTHLHSCGNINPFVPELVEIGIDCLNPLEVKAGMNPIELKQKFGDKLTFHGGINAVLWDQPEAIEEEMRRVLPEMKNNGGYIFSSDHSVPSSVSLEDFRHIVELAKQLGKY